MFGKIKDSIGLLEKDSEQSLGVIDNFITELQSAEEDAKELNACAQTEINRLKQVQEKSKRVIGFSSKMLANVKK